MSKYSKPPQRWKPIRKWKKALYVCAHRLGYRGKAAKVIVRQKFEEGLEEMVLKAEKKAGIWAGISIFHRYRNFRYDEKNCRDDAWQFVWERKWRKVIPVDMEPEDMVVMGMSALTSVVEMSQTA